MLKPGVSWGDGQGRNYLKHHNYMDGPIKMSVNSNCFENVVSEDGTDLSQQKYTDLAGVSDMNLALSIANPFQNFRQ